MGDEVMQLTAMKGCEAAGMQDAGPRSLTPSCSSLISCLALEISISDDDPGATPPGADRGMVMLSGVNGSPKMLFQRQRLDGCCRISPRKRKRKKKA